MLNREDGSDGLCGAFPFSDPKRLEPISKLLTGLDQL